MTSMPLHRLPFLRLLTIPCLLLGGQLFGQEATPQPAGASGAAAPAARTMIGSQYIPDDAIAVIVASPAEINRANQMELFPNEVFRVKMLEEFGLDPNDLTSLKVIVGMPGPAGPQYAVVGESSADVQLEPFLNAINASTPPNEVDGRSVYELQNPPDSWLHLVDPRKAVIANQAWLDTVMNADQGTGALAALVNKMPQPAGITLVVAVAPIRPIVSGVVAQQVEQLPPPLRPLGQLPDLVNALMINVNSVNSQLSLQVAMLCVDEDAAMDVEQILKDALAFGLDIAAEQSGLAAAKSGESPAVQEAMFAYITRMQKYLDKTLTPVRKGSRVSLSVKSGTSIATTGVLVGMLLPAIQASREAARRMSAANNLKQLMLAMHNYESAYGHLPAAAITDSAGKPLLSWRVALLPFLDQQALYEQFHLDEPWDSEHNLPLVQQMPEFFVDPSAPLEPGMTVFHAIVGEHMGLKPTAKVKFPEFTDGLSNSIVITEVGRSSAVPWSKPEDVTIDLDDPVAYMGDSHQGGFHVGIGDGSVRFIANNIDPQVLRALLTRDGGETINLP